MPSFATTLEVTNIGSNRFGLVALTTPATWYFGLVTTAADIDGSSYVEVTGSGYARVSKTNNGTNFDSQQPLGGTQLSSNATAITWPTATGGNYGTVVGVIGITASTGGDVLYYWELPTPVIFNENDTPVIDIGNLEVTYAS